MNSLIINSTLLGKVLKTIFLKRSNNFVFHLISSSFDKKLIFQINYNDSFYTSYTISTNLLVYFDSFGVENELLVLNYEQCEKLIELVNLFEDTNISFCFNKEKGITEIVISHNNIKLEFPIDFNINHNPIIPPCEKMYNIVDYIVLDTELFLKIIKLVHDKKYYTEFKLEPENNRLIIGDEESFKATLKLSKNLILEPSTIIINPDSIISFLENVNNKLISVKVHESLAFVINFETEFGVVYYYRAHKI